MKVLSTSSKFVSIVDDERDITELFRDALERLPGLSVFTFTDPTIAIDILKLTRVSML